MKRLYAFSLTVCLGLVGTASAQLPNVNAGSALQNRATVRVPGVDASNAARIRAGSNLDSSRLRLNADAHNSGSVRAGGVRVSGQTNAAVRARRRSRDNRNADAGSDTRQVDQTQARQDENNILLQSSLEFRNRMAEIEHMRDIAIQNSDVQLMRHADQLEIALRARHRVPSQPTLSAQGQLRQQSQAVAQRGRKVQGNVQGQTRADANGVIRGQQQFEGDVQGRFQNGTDAAIQNFRDARGQTRQGAAAAADNSARAEAAARSRGEFRATAATREGDAFRQNSEATGAQAQGQAEQQSQGLFRTGQRGTNNVQGRVDDGRRTASREANGTFRRGQNAANNVQVRGEADASTSTAGRVGFGPTSGSVDQANRAGGQVDASRRQAAPGNPAPQRPAPAQGNPTPQPNAPTGPMSE